MSSEANLLLSKIQNLNQFLLPFTTLYLINGHDQLSFDLIIGPDPTQYTKRNVHQIINTLKNHIFDDQKPTLYEYFKIVNQIQEKKSYKVNLINYYIKFINKQFTLMKWKSQIQEFQIVSYLLDDYDFVTKQQIEYPYLILSNDSILSNPALINQFNLNEQQNENGKLDWLSNIIIIYLFEIRQLLQEIASKKLLIQVFPNQYNYNFIDQNTQEPFFVDKHHFELFVLQNSKVINQKYSTDYFINNLIKGKQIILQMFNIYENDVIGDDYFQVNYIKQTDIELQKYSKQFYKGNINAGILVESKPFYYLHSLECKLQNPLEYLDHIICDMKCSKCNIDIQNYDSLFFEVTFYEFFNSLKQILLSPVFSDNPPLYICPINLELRSKNNLYSIFCCIKNESGDCLLNFYNQQIEIIFNKIIEEIENIEDDTFDNIRELNILQCLNDELQ